MRELRAPRKIGRARRRRAPRAPHPSGGSPMFSLFSNVDRLLRGHFTRGEDLGAGRIAVPARTLVLVGLVLGAAYGAFMGLYGALRPGYATPLSILASAVKVPLLFLLTLI